MLTLFYLVPELVYNLDLQYLTFITVCSLRPFSFAVMYAQALAVPPFVCTFALRAVSWGACSAV